VTARVHFALAGAACQHCRTPDQHRGRCRRAYPAEAEPSRHRQGRIPEYWPPSCLRRASVGLPMLTRNPLFRPSSKRARERRSRQIQSSHCEIL